MTLIWTRIDQKLIHGQVIVAWVPRLAIDAIVVTDQDTAEDDWAQKVMLMGLPPEVQVARFTSPAHLAEALAAEDLAARRVMVIFKSLAGFLEAAAAGLRLGTLNLGNQACAPPDQDIRLADTFFARAEELDALSALQRRGLEVILQSVPANKAVRWAPRETP